MKKFFYFLLVTVFIFGCASTSKKASYSVIVNSIADLSASPKVKYFLASSMEGITEDDLQFKEFSAYVSRALSKKGIY